MNSEMTLAFVIAFILTLVLSLTLIFTMVVPGLATTLIPHSMAPEPRFVVLPISSFNPIPINPANDPEPTRPMYFVGDDEYLADANEVLNIPAPGVLSNDWEFKKLKVKTRPSHGKVILNNDGSFVYTPNVNYDGEDLFTYIAGYVENNSICYSDPVNVLIIVDRVLKLEIIETPKIPELTPIPELTQTPIITPVKTTIPTKVVEIELPNVELKNPTLTIN